MNVQYIQCKYVRVRRSGALFRLPPSPRRTSLSILHVVAGGSQYDSRYKAAECSLLTTNLDLSVSCEKRKRAAEQPRSLRHWQSSTQQCFHSRFYDPIGWTNYVESPRLWIDHSTLLRISLLRHLHPQFHCTSFAFSLNTSK